MSGGLRTSVKSSLIAKRVTHGVHDNETINSKEVWILQPFNLNELKTSTDNFYPKGMLGEGRGFGCVCKGLIDEHSFLAAKHCTSMAVAIKRLNQQRTLQNNKQWLTEVRLLGQLGHPNLVKLIGYCLEDAMRLCGFWCMSLSTKAASTDIYGLSWILRLKIALGAAKGLAFLHSDEAKVIYGDFKTSKILLDSEYNAKLYGYGLAIERGKGYRSHVSELIFSLYEDKLFFTASQSVYAAPEISNDPSYFEDHSITKSDVYSFGVVLLEIRIGQGFRSPYQVIERTIFSSMYYSLDGALIALNLVTQCLSVEPEFRPNMIEVVQVLEKLQSSK